MNGHCTGVGWRDGGLHFEMLEPDGEKVLTAVSVSSELAVEVAGGRCCIGFRAPWPLFVQLMAAFALCRAVFFLLLALVPWSDPQSSIATFLIARSTLLLSLLPRSLLICQETPDGCSMNSLVKVLPFMFLLVGVVYLFSAWKMWNLDKFWISIIRWAIMFQAGATVVKMMIALSARYIGAAEAPLSDAMRLAIVLMIGWNLLIFGCFAFFPRIEDAYDSKV